MRKRVPLTLQENRIREGQYASDESYGMAGGFPPDRAEGGDVAGDVVGGCGRFGMEHVSVTCQNRPPNWAEMCFVKDIFWSENECAVQYHPPRSEYVNCHPYCLHIWKHSTMAFPMPPSLLVGPKRA